MLTESDVSLIRSQTIRALFHSPSIFAADMSIPESCRISRNFEARPASSLKKLDIAADKVQTSLLSAAVGS